MILPFELAFLAMKLKRSGSIDPQSGQTLEELEHVAIFPANLFVTPKERLQRAISAIQDDLVKQVEFFKEHKKYLEAKRLEERTEFDMEMMREIGIL